LIPSDSILAWSNKIVLLLLLVLVLVLEISPDDFAGF